MLNFISLRSHSCTKPLHTQKSVTHRDSGYKITTQIYAVMNVMHQHNRYRPPQVILHLSKSSLISF